MVSRDRAPIEKLDGVQEPVNGALEPDLSRPGFGLELKEADCAKYEVA
jgi:hypothetical protein